MARQKVPPSDVAPINPDLRWTKDYYDLIKQLDLLQPLSDIPAEPSFTVPAITPGSTSATTTTRSWNSSLNTIPGVDLGANPATLGNGGGTTVGDSFTKIANGLNALYANDASMNTAIAALNTRMIALENKIDAVIADLAARFP